MSADEAEREAVRRFGPAAGLAIDLRPNGHPLRLAVVIAAGTTVLVACWLLAVTLWVLPSRDPAHVVLWRVIAGLFLAYAGLTFAGLVDGVARRWLGWLLIPASLAAIALAATLIWSYATHPRAEGYLLLMGVLIGAHGLLAILDGVLGLGRRRGSRVSAGALRAG